MPSRLKTLQGETNPILTKFAIGYKPIKGIAHLVAPVVKSFTESGTIMSLGKEGFMLVDSKRALRADASRAYFAISKTDYRCVEHALETPLDYKEIEAAQKYGAEKVLKLSQRAVNFVQSLLDIELEKAVADIVFGAAYYATGNKVTLSGGDQWSDENNSDPLNDVDTAKAAVRADIGREANTGVIGYTSWQKLKRHPQLTDIYKHVQKGMLTPALVAEAFGLKNLYIGEGVYATDAGVFTDLWGDFMALSYVPDPGELVDGTTPHTVIVEEEGYPEVKTYDTKKTRDYEVTRKYVPKNVDTSFGYLITDLIA